MYTNTTGMNTNTESIDAWVGGWTDTVIFLGREKVAHHQDIYRHPFLGFRKLTFSDAHPNMKRSINQESTWSEGHTGHGWNDRTLAQLFRCGPSGDGRRSWKEAGWDLGNDTVRSPIQVQT